MNEANASGATVNPHKAPELGECPGWDGRRGKHNFHWCWCGTAMSEQIECGNCGEVRTNNDLKPFIIMQKGKQHDPVQRTE